MFLQQKFSGGVQMEGRTPLFGIMKLILVRSELVRKLTNGVTVLAEPLPNQSGLTYSADRLLDGELPDDGWRSSWTAWFKVDPLLTFNLGSERLMNKIRIYFQPTDRSDEFKEVEIWVADDEMNFSLLKTEPGAIGIRGQGIVCRV